MPKQVVQILPSGGITHFEPSREAGFSLNQSSLGSKCSQRRATNIVRCIDNDTSYYIVEVLNPNGSPSYLGEDGKVFMHLHKSKRFPSRVEAIEAELELGKGKLTIIGDNSYINLGGLLDAEV